MELEIAAKFRIGKALLQVKEHDGLVTRSIKLELQAELDGVIARALGDDAVVALEGIKGGGMSKVELPIDSVTADCTLVGSIGKTKIMGAHGLKAIAQKTKVAAGEEDEAEETDAEEVTPVSASAVATIKLTFEFRLTDEAVLFLAKNLGGYADVTFKPSQAALKFPRAIGA